MPEVHLINPKKRKSTKKKAAKRKKRGTGAKKKTTTKSTTTTTKRTTNMAKPKKRRRKTSTKRRAAPAPAPKRRRRRRTTNPARRTSRRRKNPSVSGILGSVKSWIPAMVGKLAVTWVVQRMGGMGVGGSLTSFTQTPPSVTAGGQWSMYQYLAAGVVAQYGGKLLGKYVNAAEFKRGAWDMILTKLVWTEGIGRSEWAVKQFGADGDVSYDPGSGSMLMEQGGRLNYMQGSQLVEQSSLDGLRMANDLDGGDYEFVGNDLGHYTPSPTEASIHQGTGSNDPYVTAYSSTL